AMPAPMPPQQYVPPAAGLDPLAPSSVSADIPPGAFQTTGASNVTMAIQQQPITDLTADFVITQGGTSRALGTAIGAFDIQLSGVDGTAFNGTALLTFQITTGTYYAPATLGMYSQPTGGDPTVTFKDAMAKHTSQ